MIWLAKIIAKLVISRLPLGYRAFSKLGIFRHGYMDNICYAESVFLNHYKYFTNKNNWVGIELGPGDSLISAILAHVHGAKNTYLLDVGDFANHDMDFYRKVAENFTKYGAIGVALAEKSTTWVKLEDMLQDCGAQYLTNGLASLKQIESGSIDVIWSQAVLEHVRLCDFHEFMRQSHRVLKPGGIGTHIVDYRDHLNRSLNNLRFRRKLWEKDWFAFRSGFYTNRLRHSQIVKSITDAGLYLNKIAEKKWSHLPVDRGGLDNEFENLSDEDLLIWEAHIVFLR